MTFFIYNILSISKKILLNLFIFLYFTKKGVYSIIYSCRTVNDHESRFEKKSIHVKKKSRRTTFWDIIIQICCVILVSIIRKKQMFKTKNFFKLDLACTNRLDAFTIDLYALKTLCAFGGIPFLNG